MFGSCFSEPVVASKAMLLVPAASTTESTAGKRRLEVMLLVPAASAAARAAPAETPGGRPALFYDGIGLEMRDFDFAEGSKDRCARRGRRVDGGGALGRARRPRVPGR